MKLIVCDFDGTYFTDNENILLNNQYIKELRKKNIIFMLSSGRSFKSLKEMTKRYNIEYDYLSCCDGSIIYDNKNKIVKKFILDEKILIQFLKLKDYSPIERIQFSYPDEYYDDLKDDTLIGCNLVIKNELITPEFKIRFKALKDQNTSYDFLEYSHNDVTYFCLKNKGINKSSTIKVLQDLLKIDYQDIYVFGDNENDYPMLKNYQSYYVGEVEPRIKNVCLKGCNQVYELLDDIKKMAK